MKRRGKKISILGTTYTIEFVKRDQDPKLRDRDGYCDHTTKTIVVEDMRLLLDDPSYVGNLGVYEDSVVRHEIVHAFLYESGLDTSCEFAKDETLVDWIALQFPKMINAMAEYL